jgi:hypothetical protein
MKLSQKRKFPQLHPKNQKPHLSQVFYPSPYSSEELSLLLSEALLLTNLTEKLLISFKCLKFLKKLSLKRKQQCCLLKSQKYPLSQVLVTPSLF